MEMEVRKIKEFDLSKIRIEESEKSRVLMEKYRETLEQQY